MDSEELLDERERQDFVEALLRRDVLSDAALGIAKKFVHEGEQPLSEKQRRVLAEYVIEAHRVKSCSLCSNEVPWSEQVEALDNGGVCGYCQHKWNKVMEEE